MNEIKRYEATNLFIGIAVEHSHQKTLQKGRIMRNALLIFRNMSNLRHP